MQEFAATEGSGRLSYLPGKLQDLLSCWHSTMSTDVLSALAIML